MSLRFALLALLSKEPNSGYGLQRLLRGTLSHLWDARLQQIYAELGRAQEDGLVDVRLIDLPNRPAKKVYTLTTAGEDLLDGWLADRTDAFVPKDALLIKLYCLDRIPREPLLRQLGERLEHYAVEIERARARLDQVSRTDPSQLGELLTLEAALVRAEAHVTWCGRVIAVLREAPESEERAPVKRTA